MLKVVETRALARVVILDSVVPHPNADKLELAMVGGWQCCVAKDSFKTGDMAVYCEIDSMLPVDRPEFAFLLERGQGIREVDGRQYAKIQTIKLRKEISQGLVIPVPSCITNPQVGQNVTDALQVIKYEVPEAGVSQGSSSRKNQTWLDKLVNAIRGPVQSSLNPWPVQVPKTDQERVQNCTVAYEEAVNKGELFEISYKLDGSSWTGFLVKEDGKVRTGVCSRNYEIPSKDIEYTTVQSIRQFVADLIYHNRRFFKNWKFRLPEYKKGVSVKEDNFVKMYRQYNVDNALRIAYESTGVELALQGEMIGPTIQEGFEGNPELDLYIYQVYSISDNAYLLPQEAKTVVESLGLKYVPLLSDASPLPHTVKECLIQADGPSAFPTGKFREGLVYKSVSRNFSFKAISTQYLLKKTEAESKKQAA